MKDVVDQIVGQTCADLTNSPPMGGRFERPPDNVASLLIVVVVDRRLGQVMVTQAAQVDFVISVDRLGRPAD